MCEQGISSFSLACIFALFTGLRRCPAVLCRYREQMTGAQERRIKRSPVSQSYPELECQSEVTSRFSATDSSSQSLFTHSFIHSLTQSLTHTYTHTHIASALATTCSALPLLCLLLYQQQLTYASALPPIQNTQKQSSVTFYLQIYKTTASKPFLSRNCCKQWWQLLGLSCSKGFSNSQRKRIRLSTELVEDWWYRLSAQS